MPTSFPRLAIVIALFISGCETPQATTNTTRFATQADIRALHLRIDLAEYLARQESNPGVLCDVSFDRQRNAVVARIETDRMQLTNWPITWARYAQARDLQPPLKPPPGQEDPDRQAELLAKTMAVFFDRRFGDLDPHPDWTVVFNDEPNRAPFAVVTNGKVVRPSAR
jgi:hypothetical protein